MLFTENKLLKKLPNIQVKFYFFILSLIFNSSCYYYNRDQNKDTVFNKSEELLIEELQSKADCIELSERVISHRKNIHNFLNEIEGNYIAQNLSIIEDFINKETDLYKKIEIKNIFNKLLYDLYKREVSIEIDQMSDIMETLFSEFPELKEKLINKNNTINIFYDLYSGLNTLFVAGVHYDKIYSFAGKQIEKINIQNEEKSIKTQKFIYGKVMQTIVMQKCLCKITPKEFLSENVCVELFKRL